MTALSCQVCGRRLADPGSRARGVGPVCERRARRRTASTRTTPEIHPGQTELPLRPMQPTLWSL